MKKFLVLFMSAALVLGFALVATAAEVEFGGDAEATGIWQSNYDLNSDRDADSRAYTQRFRLKTTVKVDDAEVRARLIVYSKVFDTKTGAIKNPNDVVADYAYIVVPIGPVTISAGRQKPCWGNRLWSCFGTFDRVKVSGKAGDVSVAGFVDKYVENLAGTGDQNLQDKDRYGALAVGMVGDIKVGGIITMTTDSRESAAAASPCMEDLDGDGVKESACGGTKGKDASGNTIDVFMNGPVGPINLAAELVMKMGEVNETDDGSAPMALLVAASMPMDALTASVALAYTTNGLVTSKYFTPTLFFGTDQSTAIMNFGACAPGTGDIDNDGRPDPCNAMAVVLGASYKVSDALSAKATLAYASWGDYGVKAQDAAGKDTGAAEVKAKDGVYLESAIEIDAGIEYAISDNVSYNFDIGYLMPTMNIPTGVTGVKEDAAMAIAHGITMTF